MKICPVCKNLQLSSLQHCPICVYVVEELTFKYCPKCGTVGLGLLCPTCSTTLVQIDGVRCPNCNKYGGSQLADCPDCVQVLAELNECPTCHKWMTAAVCGDCAVPTEGRPDKACPKCNAAFTANKTHCGSCGLTVATIPGSKCLTCNLIYDPYTADKCGTCNGALVPNTDKRCTGCAKVFLSTATQCDTCREPLVDLGKKGVKRTRAADGDIVLDGRKLSQEVKGAKKKITVNVETVEWTVGARTRKFGRPIFVEAKLQRTKVKKPRKGPPVPLSVQPSDQLSTVNEATEDTGEEEGLLAASDTDDGTNDTKVVEGEAEKESAVLGDLEEFDKGHLIALFLGGADNSWQIVPQVRGCNRDTWLRMEQAIHEIIGKKADVAKAIGLAVEEVNTIAQHSFVMRIYLYYADRGGEIRTGDPRIPVWFYVQLWLKDRPVCHFAIANQPRKRTEWPSDTEVQWFKYAHKKLAIPIPLPDCTHIPDLDRAAFRQKNYVDDPGNLLVTINSDDDCYNAWRDGDDDNTKSNKILKEGISTTAGPLRALQWLYNQGKCVTPHIMKPAPFEGDQIAIIRKYSLWLNGGTMLSDAADKFSDKPWNAGEKSDPFPNLDEASGQAYPEVDHILPKKSGGLNSYSNARLISFSLNHIYREKPEEPADVTVFGLPLQRTTSDESYRRFCARYSDDVLKTGKSPSMTATNHGAQYRTEIKRRRSYLRKMEKLHARALGQAARAGEFDAVRGALRAGYDSFVLDPGDDLKRKIREFAFRLPLSRRGPKQFGLHVLSDEIEALNPKFVFHVS